MHMNMSRLILAAALCAGLTAGAVPEFLMSKAVRPPKVDGVISSDEYANAVTLCGAADYRGAVVRKEKPMVDPRPVECAMTWSEHAIYVAVRMAIPGDGKPHVADKFQNPALGDSVELWFSPPAEARVGEFARFGQFQLVVDATGRMHTWQFNPGYGLSSQKWKPEGIVTKSVLHEGVWDCEIEIPAGAFGAACIVPGDWKILPCINLRSKPSVQATFVPFSGIAGYQVDANYPVFHLVEKRRSASFGGVPKLLGRGISLPVPGNVTLRVLSKPLAQPNARRRIFSSRSSNDGYLGLQRTTGYDGRQLLQLFYHASARKVYADFTSASLPADGEEAVYSVNVEADKVTVFVDGVRLGEVKPDAPLTADALRELALGEAEIVSAEIRGRCLTDAEIKSQAAGETGVSGALKWYPSENLLAAELVCDEATAQKGLSLVAYDSSGSTVGTWRLPREGTFAVVGGKRKTYVIHDICRLDRTPAEGPCRAELRLAGQTNVVLKKSFTAKRYPWFKTKLGKTPRILPGFDPVTIAGTDVSVVGRRYRIGANGLPTDIESLGRSILARPASLNFEKDGKRSAATDGSLAFGACTETAAAYASVGGLCAVRGRIEQDGFLLLDLTLPEKGVWDRIYLDVPLRAEYADLFHACGELTRSNPAGDLPKGPGRVFGSRSIPQAHLENFIPYCWVGTDDRGVYYAGDVDRGWLHAATRDAVEIVREDDGTAVLRLNLVNGAYFTKGGRRIELALGATPVKPRPADWRTWADTYINWPSSRTMLNLASSASWQSFYGWMSRYPAFGDFGHIRKLSETLRTGVIDRAYQTNFIERCMEAYRKRPSDVPVLAEKPPPAAHKTLRDHVNFAFNAAKRLHGRPNAALYYYTCDCDPAMKLPEWPVMADEWGRHTQVFGSYQDYAIYYLDKMVEAGMGGVYNDNSYAWCNYDWVMGRAWIDEKGEVHPSLSIWALREFCRREATVMCERGVDPWLTIHQTNANLLPAFAFATTTMGMEWKYGNSEHQDRYTTGYLRAVNQGLQGGFFPTCLEGIFDTRSAEEKRHLGRTLLATFLPHEIRPTLQQTIDVRLYNRLLAKMQAFGVAEKDCVYTAYWNRENPVVCERKDVLVSTYRRGARLLLVVGSWADEDVPLRLKFPAAVRRAVDLETDREVDLEKLVLARREFVALEVELAQTAEALPGLAGASPRPANETARWQAEIDAVAARGGGTVRLPKGRHRLAGLFLKSNVTLEIPEGCVVEGTADIRDYPDIHLEYAEIREPWQAIVAAVGQTNVAVVGAGEIFGNGGKFPIGSRLGRPRGLIFYRCGNVRVEGLTLRDLASWTCYFSACDGVVFRKVKVDSHANHNNDGVDIDARNVLVEDCEIDADDDGIVLKSDNPGFVVENVEVRNCEVRSCASLFKLGTASHGGFRNIRFRDCTGGKSRRELVDPKTGNGFMSDYRASVMPGATVAPCPIGGLLVECVDGGLVENVSFENMTIRDCGTPIFVRAGLRLNRKWGNRVPLGIPFGMGLALRNVTFENIRATARSWTASSITGVPLLRPKNVLLRNVEIDVPGAGAQGARELGLPVPEAEDGYPDPYMFGRRMLPAYGFYVRHADDVRFENVTVRVRGEDSRPALVRDDVRGF